MKFARLGFTGLFALAVSACASDSTPSHPNYSAAISDLRVARVILDREAEITTQPAQYKALEAIDHAVMELKDAAIIGNQPLGDTPTIDPALDYGGRLHRAHDLITAADHELSFREDDGAVRRSRDSARDYVKDARDAVEHAIEERRTASR